jgi:cellulose biosynthesis protein BcsQ
MNKEKYQHKQVNAILSATDALSGAAFIIDKPEYIIGTMRGSVDGLLTHNDAVSRTHCKIIFKDSRYSIVDLGSTNGTCVNDMRLKPHVDYPLFDGDKIGIANTEYVFSLRDPKVVLFCSASGGSGKTTLAVGAAACLAAEGKKVIYIDAEERNTFQMYLADKCYVSNSAYKVLSSGENLNLYAVQDYLRAEVFDYLPPFRASLRTVGVPFSAYASLIELVRASGGYDYLIVDSDVVPDGECGGLIGIADRVCITLTQDAHSVFKTEVMMNSIDTEDPEKYRFVCNKYDAEADDAFARGTASGIASGISYTGRIDGMDAMSVKDMSLNKELRKFARTLG